MRRVPIWVGLRSARLVETGEQVAHPVYGHADRDPAFQRRCLDLMAQAAARGQASPAELAYLTDRVLLAEGKSQEYGTQFAGWTTTLTIGTPEGA